MQRRLASQSLASLSKARFASTFREVDADNFNPEDYKLPKSDGQLLVNQPWSTKPFQFNSSLEVPIFNFVTGKFSGEVTTLD
jgi:hypothetical protein